MTLGGEVGPSQALFIQKTEQHRGCGRAPSSVRLVWPVPERPHEFKQRGDCYQLLAIM
jgi:hypothetical protein